MTKEETAAALLQEWNELHQNQMFQNLAVPEQGIQLALDFLSGRSGEETSSGDLARALRVSSARTAALLNKLEDRGLITREPCPEDGRKTNIRLTPKGEEAVTRIHAQVLSWMEQLVEDVGADNLRTYLKLSEKIKESVRQHIQQQDSVGGAEVRSDYATKSLEV